MISLLLKYHPEVYIYDTNDRGETAIDLAKSQDVKELLRGLQKYFSLSKHSSFVHNKSTTLWQSFIYFFLNNSFDT
jgi:ankyrin repeat protein